MFFLRKPTDEQISEFLAEQSHRDFTYPQVGSTRNGEAPPSHLVEKTRIHLGSGQARFDAACRALFEWQHYGFDWIELHRPHADPEPGQTVCVLVRALGVWVLNACRVVYLVDEEQPIRRFGFAYGTLPKHAESGEERFQIERLSDDSVWYDIVAFSRPNLLLSRLAYPYMRYWQRRFAQDSTQAMKSRS
jgi:uncharacterized protein (UPF0548 family)